MFPVSWGSYNSHKSWNTLPMYKVYLALRVYKIPIQTKIAPKRIKNIKDLFNKIKTLNGSKEYIT